MPPPCKVAETAPTVNTASGVVIVGSNVLLAQSRVSVTKFVGAVLLVTVISMLAVFAAPVESFPTVVAVIVALPSATPTTFPFSTVALVASLVVQVTFGFAVAGKTLAVKVSCLPTSTEAVAPLVMLTDSTGSISAASTLVI